MKWLGLTFTLLAVIALLALAIVGGTRSASTPSLTTAKHPSAVQALTAAPTHASVTAAPHAAETTTTARKDRANITPTIFAVIGDNGAHSEAEAKVAELAQGWQPESHHNSTISPG